MQNNSARRCYQIEIRSNKMNRPMIYSNLRAIKEDKKSRKKIPWYLIGKAEGKTSKHSTNKPTHTCSLSFPLRCAPFPGGAVVEFRVRFGLGQLLVQACQGPFNFSQSQCVIKKGYLSIAGGIHGPGPKLVTLHFFPKRKNANTFQYFQDSMFRVCGSHRELL